jgi:hypothetical protein
MKLTIPTWLVFLFLSIASFAPVVSRWPGWWMAYYGALLVCWVLVSVAAMRRVAREERKAKRKLARMLRQLRDAKRAEAAETDAEAFPHARAMIRRRIIVASGETDDLHDDIRRGQVGDENVIVITDRRKADRRRRMDKYVVERRRAERRLYDIEPLLLTQGWAEVKPLTSEGEELTP